MAILSMSASTDQTISPLTLIEKKKNSNILIARTMAKTDFSIMTSEDIFTLILFEVLPVLLVV